MTLLPEKVANALLKSEEYNGKLNYVVNQKGTLIIGKVGDWPGGGHIDLVDGKSVLAAGIVYFVKGKIKEIDNSSGHYLPKGLFPQQEAEKAFQQAGFDVKSKYIEKYWHEDLKLPKGGAWKPVALTA